PGAANLVFQLDAVEDCSIHVSRRVALTRRHIQASRSYRRGAEQPIARIGDARSWARTASGLREVSKANSHFVADVSAGEWVSDARLPVPTGSADASGTTPVAKSHRQIQFNQCRFQDWHVSSPRSPRGVLVNTIHVEVLACRRERVGAVGKRVRM